MSTVISPCSEFPNANTELHAGAIFGCSEPCGPCHVTDPAPVPVASVAPSESEIEGAQGGSSATRSAPGESGFFARVVEHSTELDLDAELPDVAEIEPFVTDERSLDEEHGFARVVAVLTKIAGELAGADGPVRVHSALNGHAQLPPPIAFALLHWRALLEGEDSTALPELTLDEWSAGFLAALFGADARELRNRVRSEGIAAFGVLDAA